jgi:CubicO group peptidase (beta-lactamase class C family)
MMRSSAQTFFHATLLLVLTASVFAGSATANAAAALDFTALDAYVAAQMDKHWIPGVALAVIEGDEVRYVKGYGVDGGGAPITPQTPMFIGSQSKSFTALAIAQLMEAGKLKLNDPVRKHLPWFAVADEAASAQITINHLLHHTSGLSESGFGVVLPDDTTSEAAVRALAQARLTAPVGQKHQYFNLGYNVLAYLVEVIGGQPYADYIAEHILHPLGMTHSTADLQNLDEFPRGFNRFFGFPFPSRQHVPDYEIGAGYIVSTADDLARYAMAMKAAASGRDNGLISPATASIVFRPGLSTYGLGWYIGDDARTLHISHGGANDTFHTNVDLYPERDLAIVMFVNAGHQTDHYLSAAQTFAGVQAIVLGQTPPAVAEGWSVKWLGWGLSVLVLGLIGLHTRNFLVLRGWAERARGMSAARRTLSVGISFLIPTAILTVLAWQLSAFFGYRFHIVTNFVMLSTVMPDIAVLMFVGTVPDYVQGLIKLYWVLTGKARPAQVNASAMAEPALASSRSTTP